jgi:hypothetical protein
MAYTATSGMTRRFAGVVSVGVLLCAGVSGACAQSPKVPRVGYLSLGGASAFRDAFATGLRELGLCSIGHSRSRRPSMS